uniref:Uncharacterized protein n=1 Tax=Steinernema glaseri TaxID=37863 RepID=A0A1I8AM32_9BILA
MKLCVLIVALVLLIGVFAEVDSDAFKPKKPFRVVKKPAKANGAKHGGIAERLPTRRGETQILYFPHVHPSCL